MPSVDVVIPSYNYAHFLRDCVGSVLAQDMDDLRVIIIDNASTDDSVEVALELAQRDRRIEVVRHEKNLGPHASFNEGVDMARGDYFMILCADDLLVPGALKNAIAGLEKHAEAAFVLGADAEPWIGEGLPERTEQPDGWDVLHGRDYVERCCRAIGENAAHAILTRTSVQKAAGYYSASLVHTDDLEMVLRLACLGSVLRMRAPLVIQRMHTTNLMSALWQNRLKSLQERQAAFDSFFGREGRTIPGSVALHRLARRRIAETAFWSAASHFYRGRSSEGIALMKYSLGLNPSLILLPPVAHLFRSNGALQRMAAVISGRG